MKIRIICSNIKVIKILLPTINISNAKALVSTGCMLVVGEECDGKHDSAGAFRDLTENFSTVKIFTVYRMSAKRAAVTASSSVSVGEVSISSSGGQMFKYSVNATAIIQYIVELNRKCQKYGCMNIS